MHDDNIQYVEVRKYLKETNTKQLVQTWKDINFLEWLYGFYTNG